MITVKDRRLLILWTQKGEAMDLRELEIASTALGELWARYTLQGKYPNASFSFELHEDHMKEAAE